MDEHVIKTYLRQPEVFVSGDGALLRDAGGDDYLDFLGGIAVSALGHAHPRLVEALRDQVGKLLHTSNLYRHPYTERVAAALARLSGMEAVFFCNSGTEATEGALKLARKYHERAGHGERNGFVALEHGFHGRSLGALSVTSSERYRAPFEPLVPGVRFVAAGDGAALRDALAERPAALILEPIQGEGGIRELDHGYLRLARQLCDETDTVLIHDEVQCGTGRTGRFLAGQHAGVVPDVVTLAKPLAGGLPMGALLARRGFDDVLVPGDHGSTFAGGPLVLRAALVLLDELENGLLDAVAERGEQLRAGLLGLQRDHDAIAEVRGRGLILGIRLRHGASELQQALYRRRLITNCTAGDVVRFLPPYVVTEEQCARALAILRDALAELTARPTTTGDPR